jgi:tRNA nucleotidyltransferase (CCA-adding enzyme)
VLAEITPSEEENRVILSLVDELCNLISDAVDRFEINLKIDPILVGSVAKGTHLTNPDIDIFMMFPEPTPREALESYAIKIGKAVIPDGEERYAEHPYISGKYKGFDADLVPCYLITDPKGLKSAVDRTPFHTRFIKNNLDNNLIPDVLLLKQFMKGIGVYGAEIEIQGFSGYLCELLVKYYDGFNKLVESAKDWDAQTYINMKDEPVPANKELEFKNDPLIFIDPVDPKRNVASALSVENYDLFKIACEQYLETPTRAFFFPNPIQPMTETEVLDQIRSRSTKFVGVVFKTPEVIPDILYSQLRKAEKAVGKLCRDKGYTLHDSGFTVAENGTSLILLEFSTFTLPAEELHMGPPKDNKNVQKFLDKWEGSEKAIDPPYIDPNDDRWKVKIYRKFTEVQDMIKAEINDLSLGKHVGSEMKTRFEMIADSDLVRPEHLEYLTQFLTKKYRWEY